MLSNYLCIGIYNKGGNDEINWGGFSVEPEGGVDYSPNNIGDQVDMACLNLSGNSTYPTTLPRFGELRSKPTADHDCEFLQHFL